MLVIFFFFFFWDNETIEVYIINWESKQYYREFFAHQQSNPKSITFLPTPRSGLPFCHLLVSTNNPTPSLLQISLLHVVVYHFVIRKSWKKSCTWLLHFCTLPFDIAHTFRAIGHSHSKCEVDSVTLTSCFSQHERWETFSPT